MSKAKDDEMTFVLLGRDEAAPAAIHAWVKERINLGKNKPGDVQIVEALVQARAWTAPDKSVANPAAQPAPGWISVKERLPQLKAVIEPGRKPYNYNYEASDWVETYHDSAVWPGHS